MRLRIMILAGVCVWTWARPSLPQQCPGTTHMAVSIPPSTYYAVVYSGPMASPGPLYTFIGTGCIAAQFGPNPPTCYATQATLYSGQYYAQIVAIFLSSAANVTENGCVFNCEGGSCIVRGGDGLPVELMAFEIEGEE